MTKAEEFYEARKLAYSGDFSISDSIYHPEFQAMDHRVGMEVNINMQKAIVGTYRGKFGPFYSLYEDDHFVCIHRYFYGLIDEYEMYWSLLTCLNYKDNKVIRQETIGEILDQDPSEG